MSESDANKNVDTFESSNILGFYEKKTHKKYFTWKCSYLKLYFSLDVKDLIIYRTCVFKFIVRSVFLRVEI